MNINEIEIQVYLDKLGFVPAGTLTFDKVKKYSIFSYYEDYINKNFPVLNPATLNYKRNNKKFFVTTEKDNHHMLDKTFWQIVPNKNDWANTLFLSFYPECTYMSNSEKIFIVGDRTVGGIRSVLKTQSINNRPISNLQYLDNIRSDSISFYQKELKELKYIGALWALTNYAGQRPKCMYQENDKEWVVKFNVKSDKYDNVALEHIAMEMSKDVGLPTAKTNLVKLPSGENCIFVERFDKDEEYQYLTFPLFALYKRMNKPKEFHTGQFIYRLVQTYSDYPERDCEYIVHKLLFDIAINNTDNHLHNIKFRLNREKKWELAPFFDLSFTSEDKDYEYNPLNIPLTESYLHNPKIIEMFMDSFDVSREFLEEKIANILTVVNNFHSYCDKYNINIEDRKIIGNSIHLGLGREKYNLTPELEKKYTLELKMKGPRPTPNGTKYS